MANTIQIKRTTNSTCNDAAVDPGELVWSDEHASSGGANGKLYIGDTAGDIRHIGGVGTGAVAGVINNATADELVTVASTTSELDAEATLTYNTTAGLGVSTTAADVPFTMTNTETTGTSCAHLKMVKNGADVAANESLGKLTFFGDDAGGNVTQYGEIEFRVNDKTAGDESGKVQIDVATSDNTNTSMKQAFYAVGHATSEYVDTTIGYGASSTTTVAGDLLVTGNDLTFGNGEVVKNTTNGIIDVTAATFRTSGNVLIPDAGTIGSASSTSALAISSAGVVALAATTAASATGTAALTVAGGIGVAGDMWIGDDIVMDSDGAKLSMGGDNEIELTHVHNEGLLLTHTASGDNLPVKLTLASTENAIVADEVIGAIDFKAGGESDAQDAILVAAGIEAVAEGTFGTASNATKLSFKTAASEVAAEKMSLSSAGLLTVSGAYTGGGLMTTGGNIVIPDAGTIGSATDTDAITIASTGDVTVSQDMNVTGNLNVSGSMVEIDTTSIIVKDKELWAGVPGGVTEKIYSRTSGATIATVTSASHGLTEGQFVLIAGAAAIADGVYKINTGGAFASGAFDITTTETSAISAQPVWHSVDDCTTTTATGAGIYVPGAVDSGTSYAGHALYFSDSGTNPRWETKEGLIINPANYGGGGGFKVSAGDAGTTKPGKTHVDFNGTRTSGDNFGSYQLAIAGDTVGLNNGNTSTAYGSSDAIANGQQALLVKPDGLDTPANIRADMYASAAFYEPNITQGSNSAIENAATVAIMSVPTEGATNSALYCNGAINGATLDGGTF